MIILPVASIIEAVEASEDEDVEGEVP